MLLLLNLKKPNKRLNNIYTTLIYHDNALLFTSSHFFRNLNSLAVYIAENKFKARVVRLT